MASTYQNNQQSTTLRVHQSPGSGNPTKGASSPTINNQLLTTNNYQVLITKSEFRIDFIAFIRITRIMRRSGRGLPL
ncbi:MAG: hypothetical protein ACHBN1_18900 [Heteroscytonema crispum UTEX LB 1556]